MQNANIEIKCGSADAVTGATAADGAYRINVAQQGQCTLTLPGYAGRPSASIFSSPNPALYNFDLVKLGDGKSRAAAKVSMSEGDVRDSDSASAGPAPSNLA